MGREWHPHQQGVAPPWLNTLMITYIPTRFVLPRQALHPAEMTVRLAIHVLPCPHLTLDSALPIVYVMELMLLSPAANCDVCFVAVGTFVFDGWSLLVCWNKTLRFISLPVVSRSLPMIRAIFNFWKMLWGRLCHLLSLEEPNDMPWTSLLCLQGTLTTVPWPHLCLLCPFTSSYFSIFPLYNIY